MENQRHMIDDACPTNGLRRWQAGTAGKFAETLKMIFVR